MTTKALIVMTPPVAKARPRVAVRQGRAHAYTPSRTQEAEWRIRANWLETHGSEPMEGALVLAISAFVVMPASIPKKRRESAQPTTRPDVDNYAKTVLDALCGVAFKDDSQVVRLICDKHYAKVGLPRWEITLYDL